MSLYKRQLPLSYFDGLYIRLDGTSTTTATIPFAQGLAVPGAIDPFFNITPAGEIFSFHATPFNFVFGDISSASKPQGQIYTAKEDLFFRGFVGNGGINGVSINIIGGDPTPGLGGNGGFVTLTGAVGDSGDTIGLTGFPRTLNTINNFTGINRILGTLSAGNSPSDFAVGNDLYVAGKGIFVKGIGAYGKATSVGYTLLTDGDSNQIIGSDRAFIGTSGFNLTFQAGWAKLSGTNLNAGNAIVAPGKSTGTGTGNTQIQAVGGGSSGTSDVAPVTVATFAFTNLTFKDGYDFVLGTSTGTKFGTGTTQKLAFYNSTPIAQQANTVSLETVLSALGLRASGTSAPLAIAQLTIADASNIVVGSTTGTKIGTATTQKLGFFNATPVAQQANSISLETVLSNLGFRVSGSDAPITVGTFSSTSTTDSSSTSTGGGKFSGGVGIAKNLHVGTGLFIDTVGSGLNIKEGTDAKMGTGTLSGGTATINTVAVTANSRIFLTDTGGGVLANIGSLYVGTVTAATSFVVNSTNVLDSSTFNWLIIEAT